MRAIAVFLTLAISTFFSAAGQARTRDLVMAEAFQCNMAVGDRQWLDCFYGATRALRSELQLSPLPEAGATSDKGSSSGRLQRDEALARASRCYVIADDRNWLDCFYGAAQPVRAQLGLAPAPQAALVPSGPPNEEETIGNTPPRGSSKRGGMLSGLFGKPGVLVKSPMANYKFDPYGIFTVTLANGQVWQQLSGDTSYARWKGPASKYVVTVQHGALGSFRLSVPGEGRSYKVSRHK